MIKAFGNFCWLCHKEHSKYEFAHIKSTTLKGRGRGRKERLYDVIHNPNYYMLAGKSCHRIFDGGNQYDIFEQQDLNIQKLYYG